MMPALFRDHGNLPSTYDAYVVNPLKKTYQTTYAVKKGTMAFLLTHLCLSKISASRLFDLINHGRLSLESMT